MDKSYFESERKKLQENLKNHFSAERIESLLSRVRPECREEVLDAMRDMGIPAAFDPYLGSGQHVKTHQRSNGEEIIAALPEMLGERKVKGRKRT